MDRSELVGTGRESVGTTVGVCAPVSAGVRPRHSTPQLVINEPDPTSWKRRLPQRLRERAVPESETFDDSEKDEPNEPTLHPTQVRHPGMAHAPNTERQNTDLMRWACGRRGTGEARADRRTCTIRPGTTPRSNPTKYKVQPPTGSTGLKV